MNTAKSNEIDFKDIRIKSVRLQRFAIPFKRPFVTAHESFEVREGVMIEIASEDGLTGYGECSPLPSFSTSNLGEDTTTLKSLEKSLSGSEVKLSKQSLDEIFKGTSASARFGVETALFDLRAQAAELTLSSLLNNASQDHIFSNGVISGDTSLLVNTINSRPQVKTWKIKIDARKTKETKEKLSLLADFSDTLFRLDFNRSCSLADFLELQGLLSKVNLEYIEEPLHTFKDDEINQIQQETGIKIAIDESLWELEDPLSFISSGLADVCIVKPQLAGGFFRTLELAELCTSKNISLVITSLLETGTGVAACAHIAAATAKNSLTSGLDTLRSLEDPLCQPALIPNDSGEILLPNTPGLGVHPMLQQY